MAGILGFLAALADDVGSLAGKTMATATQSLSTTFNSSATMLDDIAMYTKMASAKSSGIVIDDLAAISNLTNETTNSILQKEIKKAASLDELKENIDKLASQDQQELEIELEEVRQKAALEAKRKAAKRELPIVWKIAIGSIKNKLIIIPLILIINAIAPWLMTPILIAGGLYLAYEGAESVLHKYFAHNESPHTTEETINELSTEKFEAQKVKSAIKTDFILSLEIMVIALSLVGEATFMTKLFTLILVAIIATVAVYGIVAFIIKLDDIGFYLQAKQDSISQKSGDMIISVVPHLLKAIAIIGTVAMLAVGGGIIIHQLHLLDLDSVLVMFVIEVLFGLAVGYATMKALPLVMPIVEKVTKRGGDH